jgi:hypothetical protein
MPGACGPSTLTAWFHFPGFVDLCMVNMHHHSRLRNGGQKEGFLEDLDSFITSTPVNMDLSI